MTRLEALDRAVPAGIKISKGLDGPPEENVFPATNPSSMQPAVTMAAQPGADLAAQSSVHGGAGQGQQVQGVSDGDIEQFMDLDRMEEGFTQNYVGAQF